MKKQFEFLIYLPLAAILNCAIMHVQKKRKILKIKNGITLVLYKYNDGNVYSILLIYIHTRLMKSTPKYQSGKLKIVNQIDVYCRLIYLVGQISYVNYA